jgi:N-acyl-phosphatidylethanolamine-hydrolysing phospholipase D
VTRAGFSSRVLRLFSIALALLAGAPSGQGEEPSVPQDAETLYAPHGQPGSFFTPWGDRPHGLLDALRWHFSRNPYDKSRPPRVEVIENDGAYLSKAEHSAAITWIGHASFAIHDAHDVVLTDPHFGERALLPARAVPPGIPLEAVPDDAFAVISHNHYDHLDAYTVDRLPATVQWFVPLGLADWFRNRGRARVIELDWWQSATRGRWTITCLPSQHWSRRFGQRTNATLWCSWLLDSGDYRYYFAGDTGYFHGFGEYGRRFGSIDVAMLPIGGYEPRWFMSHPHMSPHEAYRAFQDLGARHMLPMHWGVFDLTDEPVDLAPRVLEQAVSEASGDPSRVHTLAVGERWEIPPP